MALIHVMGGSVGSPKHVKVMAGAVEGEFVGKRAEELRGLLQVKYPIEHGIVTDWEDMTSIWKTAYQELHVSSDDVSCVVPLFGGLWGLILLVASCFVD